MKKASPLTSELQMSSPFGGGEGKATTKRSVAQTLFLIHSLLFLICQMHNHLCYSTYDSSNVRYVAW